MMKENVILVLIYVLNNFVFKNAFFSLGPKIAYAKKLNTGKNFPSSPPHHQFLFARL